MKQRGGAQISIREPDHTIFNFPLEQQLDRKIVGNEEPQKNPHVFSANNLMEILEKENCFSKIDTENSVSIENEIKAVHVTDPVFKYDKISPIDKIPNYPDFFDVDYQ
jgi:hypothetical protein